MNSDFLRFTDRGLGRLKTKLLADSKQPPAGKGPN